MKKSILNLGKALNKAEQINITGGIIRFGASCSETCVTARVGASCGPPHCPGICQGYGRYITLK